MGLDLITLDEARRLAPPKLGQYVDRFGADPSGASDSTAAFNAALAALPTTTITNSVGGSQAYPIGTLYLGPGIYKIGVSSDVNALGPFVNLVGPGAHATLIYYYGSAQAFRWRNTVYGAGGTGLDISFRQMMPHSNWGVRVNGFTLDGSHATGTAIGLWLGDIEGYVLGSGDLIVQNFAGASGMNGVLLSSATSWHEKGTADLSIYNCDTLMTIKGDSAYCDFRVNAFASPSQDGVCLDAGAIYHGSLAIRGNFTNAQTTNTGACLRLKNVSRLDTCRLEILVEAQNINPAPNGATSGTVTHQTIAFGAQTGTAASSDRIWDCWGGLSFASFTTFSNYTKGTGYFGFAGQVKGDTTLNPGTVQVSPQVPQSPVFTTPPLVVQGVYDSTNKVIDLATGDIFNLGQLAGNITLTMKNIATASPRRIWVRAQQASGSTWFNITWPSNGSPTALSPTVQTPGGAGLLLSQKPSAIDWFELWTYDGATWGCRRHAAVQAPVSLPASAYLGSTASGSGNKTLSLNANVSSGNTVVVFAANVTAADASTPTVTDSKGNTYTTDLHVGSTGANIWIIRSKLGVSLTTSDTITVTWSGTTQSVESACYITGLGASAVLDRSVTVDGGTTTVASAVLNTELPTTAPSSIALAFAAAPTGGVSNPTWTTSTTQPQQSNWTAVLSISAQAGAAAYAVIPEAGAEPTVTFTPSTSQAVTAALVTYHA